MRKKKKNCKTGTVGLTIRLPQRVHDVEIHRPLVGVVYESRHNAVASRVVILMRFVDRVVPPISPIDEIRKHRNRKDVRCADALVYDQMSGQDVEERD